MKESTSPRPRSLALLLAIELLVGVGGCSPAQTEGSSAPSASPAPAAPDRDSASEAAELQAEAPASTTKRPGPAPIARPETAGRSVDGRFELSPQDATTRGLPAVGISLEHAEPFVGLTPAVPGTFANFSGPPGGSLGVRLAPVEGLALTGEAVTDHARANTAGPQLEVRDAQKVDIAGVDRWVSLAFTKTHRGHLATAWVLYPGIAEGSGVMVSAWAELDPTKTTAQSVIEHFSGLFDSLKLQFHAEVVHDVGDGDPVYGVVSVTSEGRVSVVSAKRGPKDEELLASTVEMVDGIGTLAFKAPPPKGAPRYTLAARVYERSSADYMEGLRRKLADYSVELVP